MATVAFTGSRSGAATQLVPRVVASVLKAGHQINVGCAKGVDSAVIQATVQQGQPGALSVFAIFGPPNPGKPVQGAWHGSAVSPVFKAHHAGATVHFWAGWSPTVKKGRGGSLASRLALRSYVCIASVAARSHHIFHPGVVIGFPAQQCPIALRPAPQWQAGHGSGTWSSLALAAGLGCKVYIFPPSVPPGQPRFYTPGHWGGQWVPAASQGVWANAWRWRNAAVVNLTGRILVPPPSP